MPRKLSNPKILILGLNPAWQRVFSMGQLCAGSVHRLKLEDQYASGKGINCAKTLSHFGVQTHLIQCVGGDIGIRIDRDLKMQGLPISSVWIQQETRQCSTILHEGFSTELVEPSPQLDYQECLHLYSQIQNSVAQFDLCVLCGTSAHGISMSQLAQAIPQSVSLSVDAWKDIDQINRPIELLKINRIEFNQLMDSIKIDKDHKDCDEPESVKMMMQRLIVGTLVITDGSNPTHVYTKSQHWQLNPPQLQNVSNAIGSGDVFLAAWLFAKTQYDSIPEYLAYSTSAATVRCLSGIKPWDFDPNQVQELYDQLITQVREIP